MDASSSNPVTAHINALPLKEMEASLLRSAILAFVDAQSHDGKLFRKAIDLASFLHRKQMRQSRGAMPKVHYTEHVLRVCLRLIRLNISDPEILIAAILHDTVEDCAHELAVTFCHAASNITPQAARETGFTFIAREFTSTVSDTVADLSNPIIPKGTHRLESNSIYLTHFAVAIKQPRSALVKASDFKDNALSLHHSTNEAMTIKLATKYEPASHLLAARLTCDDLLEFIPAEELAELRTDLAKNRLAEYAQIVVSS